MIEAKHAFLSEPHGRDMCDVRVDHEDRLQQCGLPARLHPVVVCLKCGTTPAKEGCARYENTCRLGGHHYLKKQREGAVVRAETFVRVETCGEWGTPEQRAAFLRERGATP